MASRSDIKKPAAANQTKTSPKVPKAEGAKVPAATTAAEPAKASPRPADAPKKSKKGDSKSKKTKAPPPPPKPKTEAELLGAPAVDQILMLTGHSKSEKAMKKLAGKIERSCKKFDHKKKGALDVDELYNVVKIQNGVDISKEDVSSLSFVDHLLVALKVMKL